MTVVPAASPRPFLRRMSTTGGSMMAAAMGGRRMAAADSVATEVLPSPVVRIDRSKPAPVRLLMQLYNFFNPVSHRLHFLFEQVSEDFEGQSAAANAAHRSPTEATRHLIDRTEMDQAATIQSLDVMQRLREKEEEGDVFVDVMEAAQAGGLGAALTVAKDWIQGSAVGLATPRDSSPVATRRRMGQQLGQLSAPSVVATAV